MNPGRRFQQSLLGNLQPLTPETAHDVDDLQAIETMIVHGALGSGIIYRVVWHLFLLKRDYVVIAYSISR